MALQLANLYRRFDLEESARPLVASAAIDGEDDAVADFLSWPDSVREQIAKKSSARSTAELLRRAAKAGSAAAARELAAGDAAAIEILAEVSPVPRMPRPRPRRLLRSHSRRMSTVLARLDLMRTVLGAAATVAGLAGIGILGTAAWLFFSNLIDSTGFSAVGHEILALVLIAPGAGAAAASFWLYGLAAERRQRLALSDSVQRLSPASRSYG